MMTAETTDVLFSRIAWREASIPTLDKQGRDSLDFHDVSVGTVRRMLAAAYEAGQRSRD